MRGFEIWMASVAESGGDSKATGQKVPLQCKDAVLECLGRDPKVRLLRIGPYLTINFPLCRGGDPRHEAGVYQAWSANRIAYLEVTWAPLGLTICSVR